MLQALKPTTFSKRAYWALSFLALVTFALSLWLVTQTECCSLPIIWSKLAAVACGLSCGLIAFIRKRKQHGKIS
jgi:hypothetical protein